MKDNNIPYTHERQMEKKLIELLGAVRDYLLWKMYAENTLTPWKVYQN